MPSKETKHILLDVDGTMLNSEAVVNESLLAATTRHGLQPIPVSTITLPKSDVQNRSENVTIFPVFLSIL